MTVDIRLNQMINALDGRLRAIAATLSLTNSAGRIWRAFYRSN